MAKDRPRQRTARRFEPAHEALENRQLLSLNLAMQGQPQQMQGTATAPLDLASFSFSTGSITDYSASISWGDSTSSAGVLYEAANGQATVVGSHTYVAKGTDTVTVTVTGDGNTGPRSTSSTRRSPLQPSRLRRTSGSPIAEPSRISPTSTPARPPPSSRLRSPGATAALAAERSSPTAMAPSPSTAPTPIPARARTT
jgi:hypothetical protein